MSMEKKHFEEWKAKTYASEKAHAGDLWDSGHNVGLEVGLSFALEYSELVNSEYVSELEKQINMVLHCFDMHDYPEMEALPYIQTLAGMLGHKFECNMKRGEMRMSSEATNE